MGPEKGLSSGREIISQVVDRRQDLLRILFGQDRVPVAHVPVLLLVLPAEGVLVDESQVRNELVIVRESRPVQLVVAVLASLVEGGEVNAVTIPAAVRVIVDLLGEAQAR